jgi:NMD protein affecting ribosome stability and mRNA decay
MTEEPQICPRCGKEADELVWDEYEGYMCMECHKDKEEL